MSNLETWRVCWVRKLEPSFFVCTYDTQNDLLVDAADLCAPCVLFVVPVKPAAQKGRSERHVLMHGSWSTELGGQQWFTRRQLPQSQGGRAGPSRVDEWAGWRGGTTMGTHSFRLAASRAATTSSRGY